MSLTYYLQGVALCDVLEQYAPISKRDKKTLEARVGKPLPTGLEIREIVVPAGTGAWQLDDEYYIQIRRSARVEQEDRRYFDELAKTNPAFARLLE